MCLKPAPATGSGNNNSKSDSSSSSRQATPRTANQIDEPSAEPPTLIQRSIEIVILIIGIDGAGKTTLLSTLQGDLDKEHVPSAGFTSATFQTETGSATFYDLGGGPAFRNVWKEYYADVRLSSLRSTHTSANGDCVHRTDRLCLCMCACVQAHGVMFVVDSSSEHIVQQSAAILRDSMTNSLMANKPLLVYARACCARRRLNDRVV